MPDDRKKAKDGPESYCLSGWCFTTGIALTIIMKIDTGNGTAWLWKAASYSHEKSIRLLREAVQTLRWKAHPLCLRYGVYTVSGEKYMGAELVWCGSVSALWNRIIPAPTGFDGRLRTEYWDYMKPSKAPTMHGGLILEPDVSYVEYLKEKMPRQK